MLLKVGLEISNFSACVTDCGSDVVHATVVSAEGPGHFVNSRLGDNMASVTWATKVSTKWVDQIDQLTDIFEEVSNFVAWLGRFAPFAK